MNTNKAWIIARKDISVFRKNKQVFYSMLVFPVMFGVLFPILFTYSMGSGSSLSAAVSVSNMFVMFLLIIPAAIPSIIGSNSIVGEKVEKSLEPLLATPTTDGELLLGKTLASFVPTLLATYVAATIFTVIFDVWSMMNLGTLLFPSVNWVLSLFLLSPLVCILSVEANVIVSARVNDVRAAQQLGTFVILPVVMIAIFGSILSGDSTLLTIIIGIILAVVDMALFNLSKATFQREEILTKWK